MHRAVILACTAVLLAGGPVALAGQPRHPALERHLAEVARNHPKRYQELLRRAGGRINDCMDCHQLTLARTGRR